MTTVSGGEVTLSDRRTERTWNVPVVTHLLGSTPVTQSLYAQVIGQRPSSSAGDRLPVESVSWWDAVRFCNALSVQAGFAPAYRLDQDRARIAWETSAQGFRLPTEAEWEHAVRAETTGPRYGHLDDIAWYRGNSGEQIHDVGGKAPNAWGLYDMFGNVWEWCWDIYDSEMYGTYRVLRGGGWFDEQWSCRASVRRRSHPTFRIDDVGFRLARSISSP